MASKQLEKGKLIIAWQALSSRGKITMGAFHSIHFAWEPWLNFMVHQDRQYIMSMIVVPNRIPQLKALMKNKEEHDFWKQ